MVKVRYPMKLLFIMKSEKLLNVQVVLLTYYTKHNNDILKNIIIEKIQESFMLMLELIKNDNQQVSISNIHVTDNLAFSVIL